MSTAQDKAAKSKDDKAVVAGLLKRTSPTASVIKAALKQKQKEESERQQREVLIQLKEIDEKLDTQVKQLRDLRKKEKLQKARVLAINEAKEQFMRDADYDAFLKVWRKQIDSQEEPKYRGMW